MNAKDRMSILFLGGAESIHTQRWVNWFAERHRVGLISFPPIASRPAGLHPEVELLPISFQSPRAFISVWRAWRALRQAVKTWHPDIVHAHLLVPNAWLAALAGHRPYVTTAWGSDLLRAKGWKRWLNRWATKRAALNTADSEELREKLLAGGCQPSQVALIQWGVDTAKFRPGARDPQFAHRLGLPADRPVIMSPRNLQPLYRIETIATAFQQVAQARPEPIFVISRYGADRQYEQTVRGILASVRDRIFFIDSVPHQSMPDLYRLTDILVSVPASDSTAVTLLEGMASGCTIIATDLPSNREWIESGKNGYLVSSGDSSALATALLKALDLPVTQRQAMIRRNRHIVVERADQDKHMRNLEQLYLSLISE